MSAPHYLTITTTTQGRATNWAHPVDCPDGEQCDILRRTQHMDMYAMADLGEGREPGRYLLGRWHLHSLVLVDRDGNVLPDPSPASEGQS